MSGVLFVFALLILGRAMWIWLAWFKRLLGLPQIRDDPYPGPEPSWAASDPTLIESVSGGAEGEPAGDTPLSLHFPVAFWLERASRIWGFCRLTIFSLQLS